MAISSLCSLRGEEGERRRGKGDEGKGRADKGGKKVRDK